MAFDFGSVQSAVSSSPVMNEDFGAPGSTSTDIQEGTATEESVAVKTPNGAKKATRASSSGGFDFASAMAGDKKTTSFNFASAQEEDKKATAKDVPGTPKQAQGDPRPDIGIDTLPIGLKQVAGLYEAVQSVATSLFAAVDASVTGVAVGATTFDPKKGDEIAGKVLEKLSIAPKSKTGEAIYEWINTAFQESGVMALLPGMGPGIEIGVGPRSVSYLKERGIDSLKKMTTDSITKEQIPVEDPAIDKTVEAWGKSNSESPKLVQTAIRNKTTGEIEPMGPKHDEARKVETVDTHDQGFLDEKGAFLTRAEAHARALQTKQISTEHKLAVKEDGLHSEDLRSSGDHSFQLPDSFEERKANVLDHQRSLNINRLNIEDLEDQMLGGKPWLQESLDAAKEKQRSLQETHDKLLKEHDAVVDKHISENTGKGTLTSDIFHDIAFGRNTMGDVLTRLKDLGFGASKHQGYGILIHQFADSELVKSTLFKLSKERVDTGDGTGAIYLGSYDQGTHTAIVGKDGGMETFLHEASHAATHAALEDPRFIEEATEFKRLYKIYNDQEAVSLKEGRTKQEASVIEYAFKDVHEFLAESINSKTFQKHLNTLQTVGKGTNKLTTVWKAFMKNVADTLGIKSDAGRTALNDVLEAGAALIERTKLDFIEHGDYYYGRKEDVPRYETTRPVTLDDTEPPKYLYHGTNKETPLFLDAEGNLILKPATNFGGKITSVSLTHNIDFANNYAARIKRGGPRAFKFKNTKIIKIHSDALPEGISRQSGEEWAFIQKKPLVIPKGKFEIIDHPLSKDPSLENPDYSYTDWVKDQTRSESERNSLYETKGENFDQYLEDAYADSPGTLKKVQEKKEAIEKEIDRLEQISEQRIEGKYKEPPVEWNKKSGIAASQEQVSPAKPEEEIPHPASVTTEEDFQNKGRDILARFGPDAAKKFAKDVAEYRKKQDVSIPKDVKETADSFYNLTTMGGADATEAMNAIQEMDKQGIDTALREKFYNFIEGSGELTSDEKEVFDKTVGKYQKEIKALYDRQIKLGRAPTHSLSPEYMPRMRVFAPGSLKSWWERMTRQEGAFAEKLTKDPSIMQERNLFTIESSSGKRTVIQKIGDKVYSWKGGKRSSGPLKISESELEMTIKEATVDEIHEHTPYRFSKDAAQVLLVKLNELREYDRLNNFIDSWKKSPDFKNIGTNDLTKAPSDWIVPKNVERLPQFMGYVFHPKTAYVIEDFAKTWNNGMYLRLTSALIKNMMLNPLLHMFNEAMHVYAARGLTGWVNPISLNRFVKTGFKAMGDIWNQSAFYIEVQREGGALMSPDLRSNVFHDKMMDKAAKEAFPEFQGIAKKVGMSPLNLYNAFSKSMQKAMWMTRDAMYLQLIREAKVKNPRMTTKEAIAKVDAHMPNYRLPSEVLSSRMASQILANPNISVFSKYHYGVVSSMANVVKDMNPKNLATPEGRVQFGQGLDSAMAYAVGMAVLYPMMDDIDQKLFGDPSMKQRRAGPFHIIDAIWNVSKGEADFKALLSPIFTFNPVLQAGVDIALNEKIPYSTRKVFHQDDPIGHIAKDVGGFAFHAVPQAGAIMDTSEVSQGFMAKQMDIKSQSTAAQKRSARAKAIKVRQLKQRLRKYEQ